MAKLLAACRGRHCSTAAFFCTPADKQSSSGANPGQNSARKCYKAYEVDLLKISNTIKQEITQLEQRDYYQGKALELTQLQLAYSEYLLARVAKLTTNSRETRRKEFRAILRRG